MTTFIKGAIDARNFNFTCCYLAAFEKKKDYKSSVPIGTPMRKIWQRQPYIGIGFVGAEILSDLSRDPTYLIS